MIFITPLLLLFSVFVLWALIKSLSRFQTEFSWNQRSRPSRRVCRTVVTRHQTQSSEFAPQCHQAPEQIRIREGPFPLQIQICRNGLPRVSHFQPPLTQIMNNQVPMSYAYPPGQTFEPMNELLYPHSCYYNPGTMHSFHEPPPAYDFRPGQVPIGRGETNGPRLSSAPCPSAPPDAKD